MQTKSKTDTTRQNHAQVERAKRKEEARLAKEQRRAERAAAKAAKKAARIEAANVKAAMRVARTADKSVAQTRRLLKVQQRLEESAAKAEAIQRALADKFGIVFWEGSGPNGSGWGFYVGYRRGADSQPTTWDYESGYYQTKSEAVSAAVAYLAAQAQAAHATATLKQEVK